MIALNVSEVNPQILSESISTADIWKFDSTI